MTASAGPSAAVFLDRDGTIIEDVTYLGRPEEVRLLPRAAEGIAVLNRSGLPVIVATNQSVVGRGMIDVAMLDAIHARLRDVIAAAGALVDAIYICPHHPDEGCECRKPRPGLLLQAAAERNLDLAASFMVGDRPLDILAGQAAGCRTVLVETGPPGAWDEAAGAVPDFRAPDLYEAAVWIVAATREEGHLVS